MRNIFGVFVIVSVFVSCFCGVTKDYFVNPNDNRGYKVMYRSETWTVARDTCAKMGAKLAVPKSREQFEFLQKIVRTMYYHDIVGTKYKLLAWLGISNLDNYAIWKNVDGQNIKDTGFHTWAGFNGGISSDPREPHCVGIDGSNFGLRDWWCDMRQPYICEMQYL